MTSHQLREARRALGWTVARLAVRSGTSEFVIHKLEQNGCVPCGYPLADGGDPVRAIRGALAAAGVEFADGDTNQAVRLAGK